MSTALLLFLSFVAFVFVAALFHATDRWHNRQAYIRAGEEAARRLRRRE